MATIKVAVCQMDVQYGQPEANFRTVESLVEQVMEREEKPDVILFPELWNTGYDLTRLDEIADPDGERSKAMFSRLAQTYGVSIIGGSVAEMRSDGVYNTSYVFDDAGREVYHYSKIHLFRLLDEEKYLSAGNSLELFQLKETPVSVQICYDIRFPEAARKIAVSGGKVLFVSAQWPHPRLNHWRQLLIARAIENQMYIVACNRVGEGGGHSFCGHSMVVDPWGEVIAEGMQQEEILFAELDTDKVDEIRQKIPVFQDRRTELYE